MVGKVVHHFYACGKKGLPAHIRCQGIVYDRVEVLKRDFFAETGLYRRGRNQAKDAPARVVLKMARKQSFLGVGLRWLGRILQRNEVQNLRRLQDLDCVPHVLCEYGSFGFVYTYIEGITLDEKPKVDEGFFDRFGLLLHRIHERHIVYLDLNKKSNILVGSDGQPYLIDFQISQCIGDGPFGLRWLMCRMRQRLQKEDFYHLSKHRLRCCRPSLPRAQKEAILRPSFWIRLHRAITAPARKLRRLLLGFLYSRNYLSVGESEQYTPENDPHRFL
ncbi:MAG: hypothetical protein JW828_06140 [Sedimentisphaerales bacterium]|nr:hypothetical protein [Sedimentisphaerales bacterium]